MPPTDPPHPPALTLDADRVLRLAAQSMFDTFARTAMGTMVVDRNHRIVWIDDGYRRFLPALGHAEDDFVGRRVEEVVPNTLMGQVVDSGQAILVDLLSNQAGMALLRHCGEDHRMRVEQCGQCEPCGQAQFDLLAQIDPCSAGFEHPQRDLQRGAIGMADCHRQMGLARPGQHLERLPPQRMEWVVNRHGRRQGSLGASS